MGSSTAIITGITGQDGHYLSELLISKGYQVHGFVSKDHWDRSSDSLQELNAMGPRLELHALDLENHLSVAKAIQKIQPDECYHLASPSFVSYSLSDELKNFHSSFNLTHSLVSSLFEAKKDCKLYYAGSSEMFGTVESFPQNESTPFRPRSLYGIAKVAGYNLLRVYREREKMFIATGLLYNHESPRRGKAFLTRKVSMGVAAIKLGLQKDLVLGNLDTQRDWGSATEYVDAMWKMLQQPSPQDFVIATGQPHTVREFVEIAFKHVGLNYQDYVKTDPKFYREGEKVALVGNSAKARKLLNWSPKINFNDLVTSMVDADMKLIMNSQGRF